MSLNTTWWVPGHEGHYGNDLADKLANIRTIDHSPELEQNHPLRSNTTFKNEINDHIKEKFIERWKTCDISQNTKELVTSIVDRQLQGQHLFKLGSELLRPLTRLITGHNNLNHFQNKIDYTTAPFCRFCEEDIHETALHLICDCKRFATTRMQTFGEDPILIDQAIRFIALSKEKDLTLLLEFTGDAEL